MSRLEGKKIILAGQRKIEEQVKIIENLGGTALPLPAQGTVFLDDEGLEEKIKAMAVAPPDWLILTTGMGTEALWNKAKSLGLEKEWTDSLSRTDIGVRGYKTMQMVKKLGLNAAARDDDGSNEGLLRELAAFSFSGKKVALQLHGEQAPKLVSWFRGENAEVMEIQPYLHIPPEEAVLEKLAEEISEQNVDAVSFTSTPQGRFLMQYAREKGLEEKIIKAFSEGVTALAVGKVTAQSLKEEGIERVIFPENERMGSALMTLARYFDEKRG
ncbi:uroporphyrinogen-III synthase [Metabacillus sp. GX 13764]|uniref:uroporphyrinogen-III synthase n=1 Tax=Metabacillus kandeliae TaxID=2900151 RepID=UPI001E2FEA80|nr:uroporphyrinogen-III synthase [Metabacillus kandeliae]MCD7034917.1 uroporphyrinogen-III synthase [Metabacillus kandeliae]